MYQKISEKISVAGVYARAKFSPKKFIWNKQIFCIDEVTCCAEVRDGIVRKRVYSVVSGKNLYRLCFDREKETWMLEEIWCE